MRHFRVPLVVAALLAIGCASTTEQQADSSGLVRVKSWKSGNLFSHPSLSIDDYDDIWLAAIGIQYAEGQKPLAEPDEQSVRKVVFDTVLEEVPIATQLGVRQAGPCTLKMGVHLAALALPRPFTGRQNRPSAVVVFELRDSQTDEPLVRYGQRRELARAARRTEGGLDPEQLEEAMRAALDDVNTAIRDAVPVNATGARAAQGCKGAIGDVRGQAKSGAR
jgi:hypothetical protein